MIAAGNISMGAVNHLEPNVFNLSVNVSMIVVFGIVLLTVDRSHFLPLASEMVSSRERWTFWLMYILVNGHSNYMAW